MKRLLPTRQAFSSKNVSGLETVGNFNNLADDMVLEEDSQSLNSNSDGDDKQN